MIFDTLVANPGRLRILTALAREQTLEFVSLRKTTLLTDGNLASHARRLEAGGLIQINKALESGKPITRYQLTSTGRQALEEHAQQLLSVLHRENYPPTVPAEVVPELQVAGAIDDSPEESWVD